MAFYDDIDEAAPLADAAYADRTQPPPARGAGVVAYNELADMKFDEAQLGFAGAPCEAAFEALTPPAPPPAEGAPPEGAADAAAPAKLGPPKPDSALSVELGLRRRRALEPDPNLLARHERHCVRALRS